MEPACMDADVVGAAQRSQSSALMPSRRRVAASRSSGAILFLSAILTTLTSSRALASEWGPQKANVLAGPAASRTLRLPTGEPRRCRPCGSPRLPMGPPLSAAAAAAFGRLQAPLLLSCLRCQSHSFSTGYCLQSAVCCSHGGGGRGQLQEWAAGQEDSAVACAGVQSQLVDTQPP